MNRHEIKKNRIAFKMLKNIGAAIQILETIRLILFRDEPFTTGQSKMRLFMYVMRSATNIRD